LSTSNLSPSWRRSLATNLLKWFDHSARDLPWRKTRDLYSIWVSEVMLQQTQVVTVIPYWRRFLAHFPDAAALAAAEERKVLQLWEGLGYYRRARQLHAAARKIVNDHGGEFPSSIDHVRSLPGIGRYTAGAILSIGLDQKLPILEANTIRVLSRLTGYQGETETTAGKAYLWSVAEAVLPQRRCGAFNQSLMELGSEICTPKSPACEQCPVAQLCQARRSGLVEKIPRPAKRPNYEDVTELAVIVRRGRQVLLRHCQAGERWAGLWDFPRFPATGSDIRSSLERELVTGTRRQIGLQIEPGHHFTTIKHGVTRFRITLMCYEARLKTRASMSKTSSAMIRWVPIPDLISYPLSVTGRRISKLLLSG